MPAPSAPSWTRGPEPSPPPSRSSVKSAVLVIVVALVIAGIAVGAVVAVQKANPRECVRAEDNGIFGPRCAEWR